MVKYLLLANFGQLFIKSREVCKYDRSARAQQLVARLVGVVAISRITTFALWTCECCRKMCDSHRKPLKLFTPRSAPEIMQALVCLWCSKTSEKKEEEKQQSQISIK